MTPVTEVFDLPSVPRTQQTQDISITFILRRPNVFDVSPALHKVIQMFCVYWVHVDTVAVGMTHYHYIHQQNNN